VPEEPASERVYESVLDAIGETPLVRLTRVTAGLAPRVYVKLEHANPGGSVKDRAALAMVLAAERSGALRPGGTIVEATSGNTGIGLAVVAAQRGYRAVLVAPDRTSPDKLAVMRAYGARVVVTRSGLPHHHPEHVRTLAERLARELPGAWFADQYDNPANPHAHFTGTGPEIWRQTRGMLTHLVAGVGTGGTATGTAGFLAQAGAQVEVVAADPHTSTYSGGDGSPYAVEAVGHYRHPDTAEDTWPANYHPDLVHRRIRVRDRDSLLTARRLAREEGLLVGPSSGMAVAAALELARELDRGHLVVVLLPDSGRGYLSTALDDTWLRAGGFLEDLDDESAWPGADGAPVLDVRPARTVRSVLDAGGGGSWPALPAVPDDVPIGAVRERLLPLATGELAGTGEFVVVLHGRTPDPDAVGTAAGELLGVLRLAALDEGVRSGRLDPAGPVGDVPGATPVTAGVGERVADVLRGLPADGPQLVPVLVDGRAVSAVSRTRLRTADGRRATPALPVHA